MTVPTINGRKLGRLPNDPAKPRLKLRYGAMEWARSVDGAAAAPATVDYYSRVPAAYWGMDGNDRVGDCTIATVDHTVKAWRAAAGNPDIASTTAECIAAYSAITGYDPADPDTDQGAVMQNVNNYWRKHGVALAGALDKTLLFAEVDHTASALVEWSIEQFGSVQLGIDFPASAMDQFDAGKPWDVVRGSRIEGGHAIPAVGYDGTYIYVVTWGQVQRMTWGFFNAYVEEAWIALSADFVNAHTGADPLAGTLHDLGEQFAAVTGQPNPVPAPAPTPPLVDPDPIPDPSPAPTPDPGAAPFPGADPAVARRIAASAVRRGMTVTQYQNHRWQTWFGLSGSK